MRPALLNPTTALFALLASCARPVPAGATDARDGRPSSPRSLTRCSAEGQSALACSFTDGKRLHFRAVRSHALRAQGGVWLVDAQGVLHRFDAHGRATGSWAIGAQSVAQAGRVVCVTTEGGALACALDRFDPVGCAPPEPPELFVLDEGAAGPLLAGAEGEPFCTRAADGSADCLVVQPVCERHCLRYPACGGALRCIDPCEDAEMLPLQAQRVAPTKTFQQQARLR